MVAWCFVLISDTLLHAKQVGHQVLSSAPSLTADHSLYTAFQLNQSFQILPLKVKQAHWFHLSNLLLPFSSVLNNMS